MLTKPIMNFHRIISLILLIGIISCSSKSPRSELINTDLGMINSNGELLFQKIPGSNLSKLTQEDDNFSSAIFFLQLNTCPISQKKDKLESTARQLFVGFEQLEIIDKLIDENLNMVQYKSKAIFDGTPVALLTYTYNSKNCTKDLIFFSQTDDELFDDLTLKKIAVFASNIRQQ